MMKILITALMIMSLLACRGSARRHAPIDASTTVSGDMIHIPAGRFRATPLQCDPGSTVEREPWFSRTTLVEQWLPAFSIDRNRVSCAEMQLCAIAGACRWDICIRGLAYASQDDARAFCAWRGGRLPTYAEWQRAARSTDGRVFPDGDTAPAPCRGRRPDAPPEFGCPHTSPDGFNYRLGVPEFEMTSDTDCSMGRRGMVLVLLYTQLDQTNVEVEKPYQPSAFFRCASSAPESLGNSAR